MRDGGAAFPRTSSSYRNVSAQDGMSMLDYFAGQALANMANDQPHGPGRYSLAAQRAYGYARAMIAERDRVMAEIAKEEVDSAPK